IEHGYDAETFLEQVCRKAGLPPDAWLDDDTQLWTFEGISIRRPLASAIPNHFDTVGPDTEDLQKLAAFARQNVEAIVRGSVANSYLAGAFDGQVQGVVFTLSDEGTTVAEVARFDPRNDMPLQATLFELCKAAAAAARTQRITADRLPQLEADLAVVWNPRLLGKASETRLPDLDPQRYALAAVLRDRWTLVIDPDRRAEELRETALQRLRSPDGGAAMLYALQFAATRTPVTIGNTARPMLGNAIRPPAVAGTFYPADPQEINAALKELFREPARPEKHAAAMLPHAGWIYSGKVAAAVLNRLEIPERVIVVSPKHSGVGADWAVAPHTTWALPLVSLQSDPDLAQRIAEHVPNMTLDGLAHAGEHAIEVLLPLIAARNPSTKVVGIAITSGSYAALQEAGQKLAEVVASYDEPPLLIISSDMSHYRDDASTRKDDREALDAMASLDPQRLYETVIGNSITMCGIRPAVLIMETLKAMGKLNRMEEVAYATSAEVSGDTRRVVGYAGVLFD
ncbi:MAG: AmmeMemoRadiSam system protein B, partial [Planctomycetota bacterium]